MSPGTDLTLSHRLRRIAIVGLTGSGKTMLAQALARHFAIPHIELDALYWGPRWKPNADFAARVDQATRGPAWVAEGNFSRVRPLVWGRAETLIWLDYDLPLILWQLTRRAAKRILTREELWNGNREQWHHYLMPDALHLWALKTYWRRRREYPAALRQPEYAHLTLVRLRSSRAAEAWLASLGR